MRYTKHIAGEASGGSAAVRPIEEATLPGSMDPNLAGNAHAVPDILYEDEPVAPGASSSPTKGNQA